MCKPRRVLLCALAALFITFQVRAQETTANLSGTVTDASGAHVAGATVKLESVALGVSRTITTSADGRFSFRFIPVGQYQLIISQSGFRDVTRNLQLVTGQDLDLPLQLELQQVKERVKNYLTTPVLARYFESTGRV